MAKKAKKKKLVCTCPKRTHRDPRWHESLREARAIAKKHKDFGIWKYEYPRGKTGYYTGPIIPEVLVKRKAELTEL